MTGSLPAHPEPTVVGRPVPGRSGGPLTPEDFEAHLDEFAANIAGSLSPFGQDVEFPLPAERLGYRHPRPENRPALAGD